MDTTEYIRLKHHQKSAEEQKSRRTRDALNRQMDNQPTIGLGHGYAPDMREAMKKVNEFNYQPTEDEIHYRRRTSGQWIDGPPPKKTR